MILNADSLKVMTFLITVTIEARYANIYKWMVQLMGRVILDLGKSLYQL